MVMHAKSQLEKDHITRRRIDEYMSRAVIAHQAQKERALKLEDRIGLRTLCAQYNEICFEETGVRIKLNHMTLKRHSEGGTTRKEAGEESRWLTDVEETTVVDFLNDMATRGFPYSHKRTKEVVDMVCSARLGEDFPEHGVGINWTYRFGKRNSHRIKMTKSCPLEDKRARAGNPANNELWWDLLEHALTKYDIEPENIYGSDEVGIQAGGHGEKEHVFGPRTKEVPFQQRSGTRENITVIATICADGSTIPPAVIFKGSAYNVKWGENNPLKASLGYQKKGWTDGEIGVDWMKIFDNSTKAKAAGRYRLLVVDGHSSHHTVGFLEHARANKIVVICYPSHATHIYQGLDVVCFAVLKHYLSQERDTWFKGDGETIDKANFLEVLSLAWVRTFTPDLVKTAFRKTGVHPFDPSVIKAVQLAPSKETSCEVHLPSVIPVSELTEPAQILGNLLSQLANLSVSDTQETGPSPDSSPNSPHSGEGAPGSQSRITRSAAQSPAAEPEPVSTVTSTSTIPSSPTTIIQNALASLNKTKLAYLASTSTEPPRSTDPAPRQNPRTRAIMATTAQSSVLDAALGVSPSTENEILLLSALRECKFILRQLETHAYELQASNVLNEAYAARLKTQLARKEEKGKKKKGVIKLVGDGLPRLLTADKFWDLLTEKEAETQEAERIKQARVEGLSNYRTAIAAWEKADTERKAKRVSILARNKKARAAHAKAILAARKKGKALDSNTVLVIVPLPRATKKPTQAPFLRAAGALTSAEVTGALASEEELVSSDNDSGDDLNDE